jgi:translation elongation factor EF-Ts
MPNIETKTIKAANIRVESYIHSDDVTPHKGGAMVSIEAETDFALRADCLVNFVRRVAARAYGYGLADFVALCHEDPQLLDELDAVRKELKEKISIRTVVVFHSNGTVSASI